jgi:hypothetical protein
MGLTYLEIKSKPVKLERLTGLTVRVGCAVFETHGTDSVLPVVRASAARAACAAGRPLRRAVAAAAMFQRAPDAAAVVNGD